MSKPAQSIHIGCAGWALRKEHAGEFPSEGTHLTRYSARMPAVEINSSFYKPHRPTTYAKWADSVPADFRFAVKVPKELTHKRRLAEADEVLDRFLTGVISLGDKLGPLLIQLPPSASFDPDVAERFFVSLRKRFEGGVVLEPRHPTWFETEAEQLLVEFRVSRAAADPAVVESATEPGGWRELVYYRLHGSPRMYYSAYTDAYLASLSERLITAAKSAEVWCIFDNTAEGAAMANALDLLGRIRKK